MYYWSVFFLQLITRCWAENSEDRPSFEGVKKTLQHINPNKLSAVDTMMAMVSSAAAGQWVGIRDRCLAV